MIEFETIKEYEDEIERLKNKAYILMLNKFPVGGWVEYYRGKVKETALVFYHAKYKCTLRVQKKGKKYLTWIPAIMCEPENSIEVRTITTGSDACKIRIRKKKEEEERAAANK